MTTVRPFQKGFFVVHNCVFDLMLPELSPTGFKLLCVAIRQTLGWNKETDTISYSQFLEKSGIRSRATISKAIQENLERGYLLRSEQGISRLGTPNYTYMLNTEFELVLSSENELRNDGSKNEPSNGLENELRLSSNFEHTTIHNNTQHAVVVHILTDFGVEGSMAQKLASKYTLSQVSDWIAYIEQCEGLTSPVGFLVSRLKNGEVAPKAESEKPKSEFVACPSCFMVKHVSQLCDKCGKCAQCCTCEG